MFCSAASLCVSRFPRDNSFASVPKYAATVALQRFPIGSSGFAEIPAGMLDGESHFVGVVAHEMEEEVCG